MFVEHEESVSTTAVLWGKSGGEFIETSVTLPFDCSANIHTYDIVINEDRDVTDMVLLKFILCQSIIA